MAVIWAGQSLKSPHSVTSWRHGAHAGEEGGGRAALASAGGGRPPVVSTVAVRQRLEPVGQRLGPVEGEDVAGARLRVEAVGEVGLDAGGLVDEGQRAAPGGQRCGQALRVARRTGSRRR